MTIGKHLTPWMGELQMCLYTEVDALLSRQKKMFLDGAATPFGSYYSETPVQCDVWIKDYFYSLIYGAEDAPRVLSRRLERGTKSTRARKNRFPLERVDVFCTSRETPSLTQKKFATRNFFYVASRVEPHGGSYYSDVGGNAGNREMTDIKQWRSWCSDRFCS